MRKIHKYGKIKSAILVFLTLCQVSSLIRIYQAIAYLIHTRTFQVKFGQLFSIQEYFVLLSYAKFKKNILFFWNMMN